MSCNNRPAFKRISCYCPSCLTKHVLKVHVINDNQLRIRDMSNTCNSNLIIPRDPLFDAHYLPTDFVG